MEEYEETTEEFEEFDEEFEEPDWWGINEIGW